MLSISDHITLYNGSGWSWRCCSTRQTWPAQWWGRSCSLPSARCLLPGLRYPSTGGSFSPPAATVETSHWSRSNHHAVLSLVEIMLLLPMPALLCHKEPAEGNSWSEQRMARESCHQQHHDHHDLNQSEHSMSIGRDQWEVSTLPEAPRWSRWSFPLLGLSGGGRTCGPGTCRSRRPTVHTLSEPPCPADPLLYRSGEEKDWSSCQGYYL